VATCHADTQPGNGPRQGNDRSLSGRTAHPEPLLPNDVAVREKESLPLLKEILAGEVPQKVPIRVNDLSLGADLLAGQKTGSSWIKERTMWRCPLRSRRALDCFTARAASPPHFSQCESVEAVDSSRSAGHARRTGESTGLRTSLFAGGYFSTARGQPPPDAASRRSCRSASVCQVEEQPRGALADTGRSTACAPVAGTRRSADYLLLLQIGVRRPFSRSSPARHSMPVAACEYWNAAPSLWITLSCSPSGDAIP